MAKMAGEGVVGAEGPEEVQGDQGLEAEGEAGEGGQEGGEAGDAGDAGDAGEGSGEAGGDPWDSELHPEVQDFYGGAKTLREAGQRYAESSREAQRLAAVNQAYEQTLALLANEREHRAQEQHGQQLQQPKAPGEYFGYESMEEYAQAAEKNPAEARRKYLEWHRYQARSAAEELFQERIGDLPQRMERRMEDEAVRARAAAEQRGQAAFLQMLEQNPEFRLKQPGEPVLKEIFKAPWAGALYSEILFNHPNQDPWAPFVRMAKSMLAERKLAAANAKLTEIRGKSGVAKSSVGGKTVPQFDQSTWVGRQKAAIAKLRASGVEVSEEMERASLAAAERQDRNLVP